MADPDPKHETTRLGSYAIVRKLAKGGMAELFLARSVGPEGFEKLVVLKKILPRYAENPRFVQLFLDEAKLAAGLDHPHIAQVYDMGRVDGNYFFTMEYVHGQDVRSILRRTERNHRSTPIELAVQIARNVASGLHYAHERRRPDGTLVEIVHRDVSPSNILLSYDGAVKLADFGVAKASSSSVRTRTGALKGKVGYMSPEQARGQTIDRRSDIFSLGVVLWELVAVRRLFKSDNDLATIQSIINVPPPSLSSFRDDCPPELDRIIGRALAKDPADRYQNAQQLQRDLEELAREHKLNQSSIALSAYLTELFETELAAWRDAQANGSTVTDFVVSGTAGELVTPVSESELSLDGPSFEEPEDEGADDDVEVDEEMSAPTAMPAPPVLPAESVDAEASSVKLTSSVTPVSIVADTILAVGNPFLDDSTILGPPPVMIDSQVTKLPVPPGDHLEQAQTSAQLTDEQPTVLVHRFPEEAPTVPVPRTTPPAGVASPRPGFAASVGPTGLPSLVPPLTPPVGVSSIPMTPAAGIPIHGVHHTPMPFPSVSGPALPPGAPNWESIDLTSRQLRYALIGGIVVLVIVIVIAIVVAAADSGSTIDEESEVSDEPATDPAPKPGVSDVEQVEPPTTKPSRPAGK